MADPIKTSISDELLRTVIRGGKFVDSGEEWMGPQRPLEPVTPPEVKGRQWDYPVSYNLQQKPRQHEPVTFEQLRTLADNLDLLRLVIETRKDLACAVPFEIRPKKKDAERDSRCDEIEGFLAMPDRELNWQEWLRVLLEDLFVIDAPCIYPRKTKGGKPYALELVDGATVVRKIDQGGRTPMPPDIAYQQVLKGLPGPTYTSQELIYRPRNRRSHRVYGFSPVEQILMTVNIAIRRQLSQLQWYTEGSVPDSIMSVPETWTMTQIREFDDWWQETLSGNTAARRQTKFVPGGVNLMNAKDGLLKDEYDEWLARVITYAFSMTNFPFVKQINRSTSETAAEQAINEGLAPTLGWIKMLVDSILVRWFGVTDLHLVWVDTKDPDPVQEAEARQKQSQADEVDIRSGVLDINEARVNRGLKQLTTEELEKRKPKPVVPEEEGDTGDLTESKDGKQAEKLEKKKVGLSHLLTGSVKAFRY
ncbi:MAG: phage portal protein [Chlorobiaceae bacterium]|nr:phage portal protein [Chlorobiaceae bacterium]